MLRQLARRRPYLLAEVVFGIALFVAFFAPVARAQTSTQLNQIYTAVIALKNSVTQQQQSLLEVKAALDAQQRTLAQLGTSVGIQNSRILKDLTRYYYLSRSDHDGAHALTACFSGYHMASFWEISDTSQLRYLDYGRSPADAGSGPPANAKGWVRTGVAAESSDVPGIANCEAWETALPDKLGTVVSLRFHWEATTCPQTVTTSIDPWVGEARPCDEQRAVWCIED